MSDYIALAVVAAIVIGGALFLLRAARQRRARRRNAAAAVDNMLAFQTAQIEADAGHDVDLKQMIEEGRS